MDYIFIINLFRDTNVDSIFYIFIVKLIKKKFDSSKSVHLFWDGGSRYLVYIAVGLSLQLNDCKSLFKKEN
jgi:hypothetical protein